ncbi:MAG: hypothetical protein KBC72_07685 [Acinetobacter sp.]|jgi:hypothetical protein|uniref:hypothetical protein n=1 Tax=uncultured Acinetobacter sp. TaxID=165433 RepID=UPI001B5DBB85|nr:hypothetical protein [uncultured Acinetobacter sp.]MBP9787432.1 hypothetical protein [Acinetobacter sp.]
MTTAVNSTNQYRPQDDDAIRAELSLELTNGSDEFVDYDVSDDLIKRIVAQSTRMAQAIIAKKEQPANS